MGQFSKDWIVRAFCALLLCLSFGAWAQNDKSMTVQEQQVERQRTQPYNNAPFWREVRSGQAGYTTARGPEAGVLIQHEGERWREIRNGPLTQLGGWLLAIAFVAALAFYAYKGTITLHEPETGRRIVRFTAWERLLHWTTAISFVLLALTGLAILFGKHVLIPVIGHNAFSWIAAGAKALHNFIGPLFVVCVLAMFVTFVKDNVWRAYDKEWLKCFGGLFSRSHHEPKSHRFNAGEKLWFWGGVTLLGVVVSVTGLILDFPNFEQSRQTMQWANIIHLVGASLFMAGAIGHIYMGTIGMKGAFKAMANGEEDETWAKEHHYYWYEDVKAGRVLSAGIPPHVTPKAPSGQPGAAPGTQA